MIEEKLGYVFKDKSLLERALTHSSKSKNNYQRLEFLGDSILNFLVGEYFFKNTERLEGDLTVLRSNYVSEKYLSECFDKIDLKKFVITGKSLGDDITAAIKADIIESLLGAIYLDSDMETARRFIVDKLYIQNFENVVDENYKSQLQELVQANFKCTIKYETVKVGDNFEANFFMDEDLVASGFGKDKTSAEQNCAFVAIKKLFISDFDEDKIYNL